MTIEPRPTLRTLAEITGLAISTVSQALRDSPEIAEETKKRVQLAATQAGYRPNRAGVRLRTGRTNVIAVVLNPQDEGSGFFADFVIGISDGLAGSSYHLVVAPYSLADPMEPIRYIVETASADGVIMSRTQADDPRVRYLHDRGIAFATHGRTDMGIVHPYCDYDNERFAYEAVQRLAERGHKHVAMVSPPPLLNYYQHASTGYARAVHDLGLTSQPLTVNIDSGMQAIRDNMAALAAQSDRPTGIVCSNVMSAVVTSNAYQAQGLLIERDFDIVSKSSTEVVRMINPQFIYYEENFRLAGQTVAKQVIATIGKTHAKHLQEVTFK
jgi:LacI family transcriptional regulator